MEQKAHKRHFSSFLELAVVFLICQYSAVVVAVIVLIVTGDFSPPTLHITVHLELICCDRLSVDKCYTQAYYIHHPASHSSSVAMPGMLLWLTAL